MPALRTRRRQLVAIVLLGILAGALAGGLNTGLLHAPGAKPSGLQISGAAAHILVDTPRMSIVDRRALQQDVDSLVKRAELNARLMITSPVLDRIARATGLPPASITGASRLTGNVPLALAEPGSEQRASDIARSRSRYRIEVESRPTTPILDVYAQAPTEPEATRIADAALPALKQELQALAASERASSAHMDELRQLGAARGGVVSGGGKRLEIGVLTFLCGFWLTCVALLGLVELRRRALPSGAATPTPPLPVGAAEPSVAGDWPHTTRVLPWMLAGFIAMLWLLPFNDIQLSASLPIDLKLDRLVLPIIVAVWVLAIAVGGPAAPRVRLTWIHAAVGLFVTCAFLSVVLDAHALNQTLELDLSVKKLPLLLAYVTLFLMVASVVRPSEVQPFMTYTLCLAVLCAVGIVIEYRFKQNLFYNLSHRLLPGFFSVGTAESGAVDDIGRRLVRGPAEVGLEAVTMMAIALPISLVGFLQSKHVRGRLLYALAACALVAATFATYRKSALLAPLSVILTLAYFRRRELLRLAPLGLVLLVVVSTLSPGALGSTLSQFTRSDRGTVPTVSDRASDYDAVRPDVWSHLALGRGWGSYDHHNYRVLDSEILYRTIETGVLGLAAYLLIAISVVLTARRTIAARDPATASVALIGAAGAVGFLVASALYDVLAFPHPVYIFLCTAGFVAVVTERRPQATRPGPGGEAPVPGAHVARRPLPAEALASAR